MHNPAEPPHDSAPAAATPDAAAMMAVLRDQQRRVDIAILRPIPWLYGIWGVAWLAGFLALWSAWDGGNPFFRIPGIIAAIIFAALIIGSIVASAVIGSRINRGVRGESDFQGAVYGMTWSLSGLAFFALGSGLAFNGASDELISVYFPSAYGLLAGTLYLGGAALWRDRGQLVTGIILLVVSSLAPFAGQPGNNLVMALGGGGTFLAAAAVSAIGLRRSPTRT